MTAGDVDSAKGAVTKGTAMLTGRTGIGHRPLTDLTIGRHLICGVKESEIKEGGCESGMCEFSEAFTSKVGPCGYFPAGDHGPDTDPEDI